MAAKQNTNTADWVSLVQEQLFFRTPAASLIVNYVTFLQNIFAVFTPFTTPAPPDDASPMAYSSQILLSETMTIIHGISWQNGEHRVV